MKTLSKYLIVLMLAMLSVVPVMAQTPAAESSGEPTPFGRGLNVPATYVDSRGTPVFTFTITELERDWQGYEVFAAPDRGSEYVLVRVSVTNVSDKDVTVTPFMITMVDSMGMMMEAAWLVNDPDIWMEDITVAPGETAEGALLFTMYSDLEPLMLMWQPDFSSYIFIYLGDD